MNPLEILSFLVDRELVHKGELYAARCLVITEYQDTALYTLAEELSKAFPVQAFYSESSLCLKQGSRSLWIVPQEHKKAMLSARDVVAYLGANKGKEPPFGIGACCRLLLDWLGAEQTTKDFSREIEVTQYKAALPGYYPQEHFYCDMTGAYWEVVKRMPSPFVYQTANGPKFAKPRPDVAARWETLKEQCGGCKPLRLSMVGRMLGGSSARCFWKGLPQAGRGIGQGRLGPAARLAISAVFELTRAGFEDTPGACYANVDCVVSPSPRVDAWESHGIPYRVKLRGDATIQGIGAYKIGEHESGLYDPEWPLIDPASGETGYFYNHHEPREDLSEWLKSTTSS